MVWPTSPQPAATSSPGTEAGHGSLRSLAVKRSAGRLPTAAVHRDGLNRRGGAASCSPGLRAGAWERTRESADLVPGLRGARRFTARRRTDGTLCVPQVKRTAPHRAGTTPGSFGATTDLRFANARAVGLLRSKREVAMARRRDWCHRCNVRGGTHADDCPVVAASLRRAGRLSQPVFDRREVGRLLDLAAKQRKAAAK